MVCIVGKVGWARKGVLSHDKIFFQTHSTNRGAYSYVVMWQTAVAGLVAYVITGSRTTKRPLVRKGRHEGFEVVTHLRGSRPLGVLL